MAEEVYIIPAKEFDDFIFKTCFDMTIIMRKQIMEEGDPSNYVSKKVMAIELSHTPCHFFESRLSFFMKNIKKFSIKN